MDHDSPSNHLQNRSPTCATWVVSGEGSVVPAPGTSFITSLNANEQWAEVFYPNHLKPVSVDTTYLNFGRCSRQQLAEYKQVRCPSLVQSINSRRIQAGTLSITRLINQQSQNTSRYAVHHSINQSTVAEYKQVRCQSLD